MKILVVDDEELLVKGIKFNLENEGYEVDVCYDGQTAVDMARAASYSLILLDLMMPKLDGLSACMKIREFSTVPIIMLTAKAENTDKLIGFEYGADDYITKPFDLLELKARVRALLRRSNMQSTSQEASTAARLSHGPITIDTERRTAEVDGRVIDLTVKEFDLVELLLKNPGKVYSRENLLDIVWGYDYQGDIRTVDVHIRRLREKLERNPAEPECIITKWGVGYYFKD
jgi:DNA-binding response OmpR family regulator